MIEGAGKAGRNKQEKVKGLEWDPTREEREDPSPEGKDEYLALTKTQGASPSGGEGEKTSSKSKSSYPAPVIKEREQRTVRRRKEGKLVIRLEILNSPNKRTSTFMRSENQNKEAEKS